MQSRQSQSQCKESSLQENSEYKAARECCSRVLGGEIEAAVARENVAGMLLFPPSVAAYLQSAALSARLLRSRRRKKGQVRETRQNSG